MNVAERSVKVDSCWFLLSSSQQWQILNFSPSQSEFVFLNAHFRIAWPFLVKYSTVYNVWWYQYNSQHTTVVLLGLMINLSKVTCKCTYHRWPTALFYCTVRSTKDSTVVNTVVKFVENKRVTASIFSVSFECLAYVTCKCTTANCLNYDMDELPRRELYGFS